MSLDAEFLDRLIQFGGRLHPMLVHFPIALIVVAGVIELIRIRKPPSPGADPVFYCLLFGALGAIVSAATGWILAEDFTSESRELFFHRWLGVAVAGLASLTWILSLLARSGQRGWARATYRLGLALSIVLVTIGGHLGGVLVHGEDYLWEVFERPVERASSDHEVKPPSETEPDAVDPAADPESEPGTGATEDPSRASTDGSADPSIALTPEELTPEELSPEDLKRAFFVTQVWPIFESQCVECHGPTKSKGRLRLDREDSLFPDNPRRQKVVRGKPHESDLFHVITYDADDPDRMPPPEEGPPLTAEQVEAIRLWIENGAHWGDPNDPRLRTGSTPPRERAPESPGLEPTVGDDPTPPESTAAQPAKTPRTLTPQALAAIEEIVERGGHAQRIAANTTDTEVNLSVLGARATDADLALLGGLEPHLTWLRLARTSVTDAGVAKLAGFTRLARLDLGQTAIGDDAVDTLSTLRELEVLNLHSTRITEAGVERLTALPKLKRIYLWNAAIDAAAAARLEQSHPKIDFDFGVSTVAEPDGR